MPVCSPPRKGYHMLRGVAWIGRKPAETSRTGTSQPLKDSWLAIPAKEPLIGIYGLVSQANFVLSPNLRILEYTQDLCKSMLPQNLL